MPSLSKLAADPTKKIKHQSFCVNCQGVLTGPFCAQCGQKTRLKRFTLRSVIADAIDQFFSLDRGLIHTTAILVKNPGKVIKNYVAGRTVPYSSPVRYFLLWITVGQFMALWSGGLADFARGFAAGAATETGSLDAASVAGILTKYYVVGLAGLVPLLAIWTRLFLRRAKRNIAEHMIFHLYLSGQFALFTSLALVVEGVFGDPFTSIAISIAPLAGLLTVMRAGVSFFTIGKWKAALGTLIALFIALICYALLVGGGLLLASSAG
jgi:hypothetical protein